MGRAQIEIGEIMPFKINLKSALVVCDERQCTEHIFAEGISTNEMLLKADNLGWRNMRVFEHGHIVKRYYCSKHA